MAVIGIDPDSRGGVAVIEPDGVYADVWPAACVDIGITKTRNMIDPAIMVAVLRTLRERYPVGLEAWVESTSSFNSSGAAHSVGMNFGVYMGILIACDIDAKIISPQRWKYMHGLHGRNKDKSREKALSLYPQLADKLKYKKDHGKAEALLIAEAGLRMQGRG